MEQDNNVQTTDEDIDYFGLLLTMHMTLIYINDQRIEISLTALDQFHLNENWGFRYFYTIQCVIIIQFSIAISGTRQNYVKALIYS